MNGWSAKDISRFQRTFIIHTFIYYELNNNVWSDVMYDEWAIDLEKEKETSLYWKHSKYYELFKDWTSATGIGLINKEDKEHYKYFKRQASDILEAHLDYIDILP